MRSVKSVADLKSLALTKGATVEMSGTRFNTTNEKIQAPRKQVPVKETPAPVEVKIPELPAPVVNVDMEPVASALEKTSMVSAQLLQLLIESINQQKPSKTVQEWEFSVVRNADGTLASIRAKAIR